MADLSDKYRENVPGKFYVDRTCISCISCVTVAPKHFQMFNGNEHSCVVLQPSDAQELADCVEAMRVCPVNAIGDDADRQPAPLVAAVPTYKARLLESIRLHAGRPALVHPADLEPLSYQALGGRLDQVAALLKGHGIRPGDVVSLVSENSVDLACLLLGCVCYGAVAMPVNPKLSAGEMDAILWHSGSKLLLADRPLGLRPSPRALGHTWDYRKLQPWDRHEWTSHAVDPDAGALLIYTSGTTGRPKGVLLNQGNLASNVAVAVSTLGLDADHNKLCLLPLFHTFGFISDLSTALFCGALCVVSETFDVTRLGQVLQALRSHRVRSFSAVPLMFDLLVRLGADLRGGELSFCVSGAAPLRPKVAEAFKAAYGLDIVPAYGLTETTCFATISPRHGIRAGSAGRPAGLEIRVLDGQDRPLPPGESGEIALRGPGVIAGGYYKDNRECYAQGEPGWFKTGDLGAVDADGYLFITGRKKNMVIRGGEKVFLEDVDSCLIDMDGVQDCASVRLDGRDAEKFATVVVPGALASLRAEDVMRYLKERISAQKAPDVVLFSDAIPRTATNKVKLADLLAQTLQRI